MKKLAIICFSLAATAALAATTPPPQSPAPAAMPAELPPAAEAPAKPSAVIVEEAVRGKLLYENHCQACHTSLAHVRNKRRARSIAELHQWVGRWTHELGLPWGSEEISDVVDYLNDAYYQFEIPAKPQKKPQQE